MKDNLNVIGLGQAGTRISRLFDKFGVNTYYANSDEIDFRGMNIEQSKMLIIEGSGTGCSITKGLKMVDSHKDEFTDFLDKGLSEDKLNLFIFGLGGGSGSSMSITAVKHSLDKGYRTGILTVLPSKMLGGMVGIDNAVKALKILKDYPVHTFMMADNEHLIANKENSKDWWATINNEIFNCFSSSFEIIKAGKTSQLGVGSIDKGELMRILQYGKGAVDMRTFYLAQEELQQEDCIKNLLNKPQLTTGYNYKDSLSYIVNIDTPVFGSYSEIATQIIEQASKYFGSGISKMGMFVDPTLSDNVRITFINAGMKLPKVVTKDMKVFNRETEKFNKKKDKEEQTDFSLVEENLIDDDFDF